MCVCVCTWNVCVETVLEMCVETTPEMCACVCVLGTVAGMCVLKPSWNVCVETVLEMCVLKITVAHLKYHCTPWTVLYYRMLLVLRIINSVWKIFK